jgi:DNA-binding NarL/FixJ family response regulator
MNDRYKSIPVLVYSTYTDETLIKNCTEMGACSVMPKPVTKEGYNQLIDTVLQICH